MSENLSSLEKDYRSLVLSELKELSVNQKDNAKKLDDVKSNVSKLEHALIGVDGKNGLRSRVEKIEREDAEKAEIRFKEAEAKIDKLERFNIKLITIFAVIQIIATAAFSLILKFWK